MEGPPDARPDDPPDLLGTLLSRETAVWEALACGDAAADRAALASGFLGIYPDGFAGRDDHVGQLARGPTVAEFHLDRARITPLGPDRAALSYHARFRRVGAEVEEAMWVTSVWQRDGDGWINLLSQDTPARG
ncbi:nuclear transport factor 2 family protein [Jannaschia sp. GRR-S6-38]|uniref:Nuclear transport factor 2 family protein n=1 Tax=Jannaschia ovalis TaxID=3038773 RepID=A0ABY8LGA8_9RHOB|nr:nuclear transport factor 2 family protein [Jannaschia sp. GRR-S6-38]WGH80335.1 nuclear transport factor 2 family protein [Jannaschia sp. GRR-S6-38]